MKHGETFGDVVFPRRSRVSESVKRNITSESTVDSLWRD